MPTLKTMPRKKLSLDGLRVETFSTESKQVAEEAVAQWSRLETNCLFTGIDSTCPCCSEDFTCPCSYPNC